MNNKLKEFARFLRATARKEGHLSTLIVFAAIFVLAIIGVYLIAMAVYSVAINLTIWQVSCGIGFGVVIVALYMFLVNLGRSEEEKNDLCQQENE